MRPCPVAATGLDDLQADQDGRTLSIRRKPRKAAQKASLTTDRLKSAGMESYRPEEAMYALYRFDAGKAKEARPP